MRRLLVFVLILAACGGGQSVFSMEVGMCFDDQEDGPISSVPVVECSVPHDNEVFAIFDYTEAAYPGDDAMNEVAKELCKEKFEAYVGLSYPESELEVFPITPTQTSWDNENDREIVCALYNLDFSKLTGSMEGAAR